MRWEKWGYLFAFLCGVVFANVLGSRAFIDYNLLNRYNMSLLSFEAVSGEAYFVQVLLLRLQTVVVLGILCRLLPKRVVIIGFGCLISALLGGILAAAILANGVWGIWFGLGALLPHGIFYLLSYLLWYYANRGYVYQKKGGILIRKVLMVLLVVIGSICEAYLSPVLVEKMIKI